MLENPITLQCNKGFLKFMGQSGPAYDNKSYSYMHD